MFKESLIHFFGGLTYEEAWEEMDNETVWLNKRIDELEHSLAVALLGRAKAKQAKKM